ncbi:MAG: type VI secretion system contractile sheath large subunit [Planctomycetes bacterium]|nr:type VI secretion system contractile sheath large subunit [Planctomycetota bacterium]
MRSETGLANELPLRLLVLADFTGGRDNRPVEEREPIRVDRDGVDELRRRIELRSPGAAWRDLKFMLDRAANTEVCILNVSKNDLFEDFQDSPEIVKSGLHFVLRLCAHALPYAAIIAHYEFSHEREDVWLLQGIAAVAALMDCPFLSAVSPRMFGSEPWEPIDLDACFDGAPFDQWRRFRESKDAAFVALLVPALDAPVHPAFELGARIAERRVLKESAEPREEELRLERVGFVPPGFRRLPCCRPGESLPDRMAVSRIAHRLRVIHRERIGHWDDPAAVERELNGTVPEARVSSEADGSFRLTVRLRDDAPSISTPLHLSAGAGPGWTRSFAPRTRTRLAVSPPGDPTVELSPPFRILVLADFTGEVDTERLANREIVRVDRESLDAAMEKLGARNDAARLGVKFLVERTDSRANVEIFLLNASKQDLADEFETAGAPRKSGLYRLVVEGGPDWSPMIGAIIGDYEFSYGPNDLRLLSDLARVARAAHAPFIAAPSPKLFGIGTWQTHPHLKDLMSIFEGAQYARWREFRFSRRAAYVALACPRFLLRPAEGEREAVWGNAAFAFGSCLAAAFAKEGWCANIAGPEGGGLVPDLFDLEIPVVPSRERELAEEGFLVLGTRGGRPHEACFYAATSCRRPREFGISREAREVALAWRVNSQLSARFVAARVAHLLKFLMREVQEFAYPSFRSLEFAPGAIAWLSGFTGSVERLPLECASAIPFRTAAIRFSRSEQTAVVTLQPNFAPAGSPFTLTEMVTFRSGDGEADPFGVPECRRRMASVPKTDEFPFSLLVLADFTGREQAPLEDRRPFRVDRGNLNAVLKTKSPELFLDILEGVHLRFEDFSDFEPDSIVRQVPEMRRIAEDRLALVAVRSRLAGLPALAKRIREQWDETGARETMLGELALPETAEGADILRRGVELTLGSGCAPERSAVDARIARIDRHLTGMMDAILGHPEFQRLEASWRGLKLLVDRIGAGMKVAAIDVSKRHLLEDIEDAPEIEKSGLHKAVYMEHFGTFGGEPYGAVIADYEFSCSPPERKMLRYAGVVAQRSACPFIASAAPGLFGAVSWEEVANRESAGSPADWPWGPGWATLLKSEAGAHVGLCLPRALLRAPHAADSVRSFRYEGRTPLWGNAAFAFGARLIEGYVRWRRDGRLADWGGEELDEPLVPEVSLPERIADAGFMPLVARGGRFGFHDARLIGGMRASEWLLPWRFLQLASVVQRDYIGSWREAWEVQRGLRAALRRFVAAGPDPGPEILRHRPLRSVDVTVEEFDRASLLQCRLRIWPWGMKGPLTASILLSTK